MNYNYKKQNNDILKFILNERFFSQWKEGDIENPYSLARLSEIEIYITNKCNQHCEYCYLHNNEELYPPEVNNEETILQNLNILYNWLIKNKCRISRIEFYSGEIWQTEFGLKILEITYQALLKGLNCKDFVIPTNGSFITDNYYLYTIQNTIDNFALLDVRLEFSFSIDGAIIDNINRPKNSSENLYTEDFYNKVFAFACHNNYRFHPMVAACSIEKWIENFKWWKEKCETYKLNVYSDVMMLEVRNDDWTEEKIKEYCNFLNYMIEDLYENDRDFFFRMISGNLYDNESIGYCPIVIVQAPSYMTCSISDTLTIRLGDLAIAPCHRLSYDKFLYGHFIVENDEIVDIDANNFYMANRILLGNNKLLTIGCDVCYLREYCIKNCMGVQLEVQKDPFIAVPNLCNFFKKKYHFLAIKYKELGLLEQLKTIKPDTISYEGAKKIVEFCETIIKEEK